jgi:hypothetical protein
VAHRYFAGEELHLKIAVSIVLLFGLLASQAAFAKSAHAPAHAPPAGAAPATNLGNTKPPEPIDADVTVLTSRGGFTPVNRNAKTSLEIVKPENFTHRPAITVPIKPVVRNAIGQPVQSRSAIEPPRLAPSVQVPGQVPGTVPRAGPRSVLPVPQVSPSTVGRTPLRQTTTVGISSSGRIDGARLIRPSAAPLGVGGPAHPVGGINGTTVRTTR